MKRCAYFNLRVIVRRNLNELSVRFATPNDNSVFHQLQQTLQHTTPAVWQLQGGPKKYTTTNLKKIALKIAKEIRFLRKVKV